MDVASVVATVRAFSELTGAMCKERDEVKGEEEASFESAVELSVGSTDAILGIMSSGCSTTGTAKFAF